MTRRYYGLRTKPPSLTLEEVYWKLQNLYFLFRGKDYFRQKARITETDLPDEIKHEAAVALTFQLFPITKWSQQDITEDHVFEAIEFLYDYVSKPGEWVEQSSPGGYVFWGYDGYDDEAGRTEFGSPPESEQTRNLSGFGVLGLIVSREPPSLWKCWNPALFAGFPSAGGTVEKSG